MKVEGHVETLDRARQYQSHSLNLISEIVNLSYCVLVLLPSCHGRTGECKCKAKYINEICSELQGKASRKLR